MTTAIGYRGGNDMHMTVQKQENLLYIARKFREIKLHRKIVNCKNSKLNKMKSPLSKR